MLENDMELRHSFEAIVKLYHSRDGYLKAIPDSEMRDAVIEGIDIQICKIEKEIFEYLQKRQEKEQASFPYRQTNSE